MQKPMLPTLTFEVPEGKNWVYEVKYDGFRAFLEMRNDSIQLTSRNGKDLLPLFPEVEQFYLDNKVKLEPFFPLLLDGELCILENTFKSNFSKIQTRGRLRAASKIQMAMKNEPAHFLAFDLLLFKGEDLRSRPYTERKHLLKDLLVQLGFPLLPDPTQITTTIQFVPYEQDFSKLWNQITTYDGEGMIAKQLDSKWEPGKRTANWLKYKNYKKVHCFVTAYEKENGFFHVAVYERTVVKSIGLFKNGLTREEYQALIHIIKNNSTKEDEQFIYVPASICLELNYLELYDDSLREPNFSKFLFDKKPEDCTIDQLEQHIVFPVEITHPEKPLWKTKPITKLDYLQYMRFIYPYVSPFLENRTLTVIRYPHGLYGEAFFQKNCPDYAPSFVNTFKVDGIEYIVCNNLETYIWLGNQLAIEFHIPFKTIEQTIPSEIVIDLDPPTKQDFAMAVEAAIYIKEDIVDKLGLQAFLKVSGNRGLQIYFPLKNDSTITWNDSRIFTEFVAKYVIAKNEKHFTIERMKKNRGHRLYIDYVQHAEGKTIICPFSLRGNENAGVAAPIEWDELRTDIRPDGFSMEDVINRIEQKGNPFQHFFQTDNEEALKQVLNFLKK